MSLGLLSYKLISFSKVCYYIRFKAIKKIKDYKMQVLTVHIQVHVCACVYVYVCEYVCVSVRGTRDLRDKLMRSVEAL